MPDSTITQFPDSKEYCNNSNSTFTVYYYMVAAIKLTLVLYMLGFIGTGDVASSLVGQDNRNSQNSQEANTQSTVGWAKGRLLITPRAGLPIKELKKALEPHGVRPRHHLEELNLHICDVPAGSEKEVMEALKKDPRLKDVELDMIVTIDQTITDPSFDNSWALPKIKAPTAWDTSNGDGIIIAILDTGVDGSHPDLAANMVPGWNMFDNNADTSDPHGHGTAVAGTAAAAANNGEGSAGVAWASEIMPIRISDPGGRAFISTIANGIRWAADNGARVVNNSFSGVAGSRTIQAAAQYMQSKGGVVVVSAGNTSGSLNFSASNAVIVASATGKSDTRPGWSSFGPYVDVAAPGVGIYTTAKGGGYRNYSGTSFSSPVVAATAALMLSANNDLTPTDVDRLMKETALDLGDPGFDDFYGAGRIDAAAAVAAASATIGVDDKAPSVEIILPTSGEVSGIVPVDVRYSDNVGVVRVELFVNGKKVITDSQSPFAFAWDSAAFSNGDYTLKVHAFDAAGNQGTSADVSVTVNNVVADSEAPVIAITSPAGGEAAGNVSVNTSYSDNVAVVRVDLFVNGQKTMTSTQAPFDFSWDTSTLADGAYTLIAYAYDEAGNEGISSTVSVTVKNNTTEDTTAPRIIRFNLKDGMKVRSRQRVIATANDNEGKVKMTLIIDGKVVVVRNRGKLYYNWFTHSGSAPRGTQHTVTIEATDQAGNTARKTATVNN